MGNNKNYLTSFPTSSGTYASGYDYSSGDHWHSEDFGGTLFVNYRVDPYYQVPWDVIKEELDWRFFKQVLPNLFNGWIVCRFEYTKWVDVSGDYVYGIVGKMQAVMTKDVVIPVIKSIDYVLPKDVKVLCGACGNIFIQSSRGACNACGAPASWTYTNK